MDKLLIALAVLLLAWPAQAANPLSAAAPAGAAQVELRVRIEGSALKLVLCTKPGCKEDQAEQLTVPPEAAPYLNGASKLAVVDLGKGRKAIHATVSLPGGERAWQALIAAPVDGGSKVKVLWAGMTGWTLGELGERHGPMISIQAHSVLVGEAREDIQLCGRPTILSPRAVVATDLSLRPAKVQQLPTAERTAAPKLTAKKDSAPPPHGSPLRAVAASSAVGSPQALTDGNVSTFWGENRGSDGRGEFVTLRASKQLALSAFHLRIHPGSSAPAQGAAPRELWLVTDSELFHVTLPENGWQAEAPVFRVDLPKPVSTECLALVLEKGYESKDDSQIIVSELWGSSTLGQNWDEVSLLLDAGGAPATAAAEALSFGGEAAHLATAKAFQSLSAGGKMLALEVLDQAACTTAAPIYWAMREEPELDQNAHHRRLLRCRREVAVLSLTDLEQSTGARRSALIKQLADFAPEVVVEKAPRWLGSAKTSERKAVRQALRIAADHPDAEGSLRTLLRNETLPPGVEIDVLRALSARAQRFSPEFSAAFRRNAQRQGDFARQFLLLEPAGALSGQDAFATDLLRTQLLKAPAWELRGEAAHRANPAVLHKELVAALSDPEVRVRLAAVEALHNPTATAVPALLERLATDPWPMVRAAAVRTLLVARDPRIDAALVSALNDESRHVRRPVAHALGLRNARAHKEVLRDLLQDDEEDPSVRAAAAVSVGQLCDHASVDTLTGYARVLASLTMTEPELVLGRGALQGLAFLKPKDLAKRLSPLLDPKAPAVARRLGRQALAAPSSCSTRVAQKQKRGGR